MANRTIRRPEREAKFLAALAEGASIVKAAQAAGLGRETVYGWRRADEAFAERWDEAVEAGTDGLEDEALRRARDGVKRPVYQGGKLVGYERHYSDTLLIFMLKARRPEKYRERASVELTGKGGGPIEVAGIRERVIGKLDRLAESAGGESADG